MDENNNYYICICIFRITYGNLFVNTIFFQTQYIDKETRSVVVSVLLILSIAGTAMMALLPPPQQRDGKIKTNNLGGPILAIIKTFSLASTKNILILSAFFLFTGNLVFNVLFLTFYTRLISDG